MPADDDPKKQSNTASNMAASAAARCAATTGGRLMTFRRLLCAVPCEAAAGVAPMMALAALPLFGFVGAAVDYSRANSARTAMQAALDASALMMSKDAQTMTAASLAQKANDDFNATFTRPEA